MVKREKKCVSCACNCDHDDENGHKTMTASSLFSSFYIVIKHVTFKALSMSIILLKAIFSSVYSGQTWNFTAIINNESSCTRGRKPLSQLHVVQDMA